jgi:hypothetical protein
MKNLIILLLSLFLSASTFLSAQDLPNNQVNVGYGMFTSYEAIGVGKSTTLINSSRDFHIIKNTGAIRLEYFRVFNNRLKVGASFTYQKFKFVPLFSLNIEQEGYTAIIYTPALETAFTFLSKKNFDLYSGLGLGHSFTYDKENRLGGSFNSHLDAVGIRVGRKIGGFVAVGYGYKGLIHCGVNFRF